LLIHRDFSSAAPSDTAVALGFFDGIHFGHREIIEAARDCARREGLECAVFTFTVEKDGKIPDSKRGFTALTSEKRKLSILESLGVQFVLEPEFKTFASFSAEEFADKILVKALRAKYVFCGGDYKFAKGASGNTDVLRQLCAARGIKVEVQPEFRYEGEAVSSSRIRRLISEGETAKVRKMGFIYTVDGEIIHGRAKGKSLLGIPTVNQLIPSGFTVPKRGVYASRTTLQGKDYPSVTNIGVCPTFGENTMICETHIIGFSGDVYGMEASVALLDYIRPEKRFPSTDELRIQIMSDIDTAVRLCETEL